MEASGRSLPEAKEIVLDLLGVAEDDAEFVVISEPKAGLFGRLRGEARVQARVRPVAPPPKRTRRPKSDRRRERGETSRNGGSGKSGAAQSSRAERGSSPRATAEETPVRQSKRNGEARGGPGVDGSGAVDSGAATNGSKPGSSHRSGGQRRRRREAGGGSNQGQPDEQGKQSAGRRSGESESHMEESLTLEQQGQAAAEFLAGLVKEFGLDAEVEYAEIDEDTVQVAADGGDLGLLVGPRGATLSAVQDLTRTFVQRQSENRTDRILVDVGGYRQKRIGALRRFTEGIVHEVAESGEERALEPMSAADRKVVHATVSEMDGVETRSEGTEPTRYVVITPLS